MKKLICALLALLLTVSLLAGCSPGGVSANPANAQRSIVVTIFPIADWIYHLIGAEQRENWSITILQDNGADLHSYQATADDMVRIANCDLFVCVGGESDKWVESALANGGKPARRVVRLMDALGSAAKNEEYVEGMETEEEEDEALDEHIWLSLKNAIALCGVLADTLAELDPEHASDYSAEDYTEQLRALDAQYAEKLAAAARDTVVCADRFPFRYLMDDYNIKYYAAFAGCSAESEASFETVVFLAGKVDELELHGVIQTETSDGKLAHTVLEAAESGELDVIFTLNSMQSGTVNYDTQSPELLYPTYLDIMADNLETLLHALNAGAEE